MKKYLKILFLLGTAFLISDFSIKNVFIAQSPKLNHFFAQNMMAKVNLLWSKTTSLIAFKNTSTNKFSNNSNNFSQPTNNQASFTFQNKNSLPQNVGLSSKKCVTIM